VLISFMPEARRDSVAAAMKEAAAKAAANPRRQRVAVQVAVDAAVLQTMQPVGPFTKRTDRAAVDSGRAVLRMSTRQKAGGRVVDSITAASRGYAASVGGIGGIGVASRGAVV